MKTKPMVALAGIGLALWTLAQATSGTPNSYAQSEIRSSASSAIDVHRAQRLEELRNRISAVRPDYAVEAEAAYRAERRLSVGTYLGPIGAQHMVSAIYTSPQFRGTEEQAVQVGMIFADLGKQLGVGPWLAACYAQEAFNDPEALAGDLSRRIVTIDPTFAYHIRDLQESGKKAEASNKLIGRLFEATEPVRHSVIQTEKH